MTSRRNDEALVILTLFSRSNKDLNALERTDISLDQN